MGLRNRITQHRQTVRIASAIALAAIAVRSFIQGNRLTGVLAAGGAVAVAGTTSTLEPTELEIETETEVESTATSELRCSTCNDPIVPGQPRRPNKTNQTVHEACL